MKRKDVLTDDLLKKGHAHKEKELIPEACPDCGGFGRITMFIPSPHYDENPESVEVECPECEGEGVVYG